MKRQRAGIQPQSPTGGPRRSCRNRQRFNWAGQFRCLCRKSNVPTPWIVCGPSKNSIVGALRNPQIGVEQADLGEFVGHPGVGADAVAMAALDHERPRGDQAGHLGIVVGVAQVELEDLVLAGGHVAVGRAGRGVLPDPFVEIGRADRQAIALDQRRHAHRRLAAVGETVETRSARDRPAVKRGQPIDDLLVLRHDDREQRLAQRVGLALQRAKLVGEDVRVLRREDDEAALGQPAGDTGCRPG